MAFTKTPFPQRFFEKIALGTKLFNGTHCLVWQGAKTKKGYGTFWDGKRYARAYRVAYELWIGPIPEGLQLDHLCRNPTCVNVLHLEPVTPAVNVRRAHGITEDFCSKKHRMIPSNVSWYKGRRLCRQCKNGTEQQRRDRLKTAV